MKYLMTTSWLIMLKLVYLILKLGGSMDFKFVNLKLFVKFDWMTISAFNFRFRKLAVGVHRRLESKGLDQNFLLTFFSGKFKLI